MLKKVLYTIGLFAAATAPHYSLAYKPGDTVAAFSLKNVDGRMISLSDYQSATGLIVIFTANHCPFARLYQQRMNDLSKVYAKAGVPLIAISSNDAALVPEDSYSEMVRRAKEKKYSFPYLYDSTQAVAKAFEVVKTPQAYVLKRDNGSWTVVYSGAIDDNGANPDKVTSKFVEDAVNAIRTGRPVPVASTKSVGCAIKWRL